jgi:hypothetical protein
MRNWVIAGLALVFFGFSLFQASWLASAPGGAPRLIAGKAPEPLRDSAGCASSTAMGYFSLSAGPDINALALAAGNEADVVHVTTAMADGKLAVAPQFEAKCAADKGRTGGDLGAAAANLSKPALLWRAKGAGEAQQLLAAVQKSTAKGLGIFCASRPFLRQRLPIVRTVGRHPRQLCAGHDAADRG